MSLYENLYYWFFGGNWSRGSSWVGTISEGSFSCRPARKVILPVEPASRASCPVKPDQGVPTPAEPAQRVPSPRERAPWAPASALRVPVSVEPSLRAPAPMKPVLRAPAVKEPSLWVLVPRKPAAKSSPRFFRFHPNTGAFVRKKNFWLLLVHSFNLTFRLVGQQGLYFSRTLCLSSMVTNRYFLAIESADRFFV